MSGVLHKAELYTKKNSYVFCHLCAHGCRITPGARGLCAVRENRDGMLHSLVYGRVAAEKADPVEKKPLYHYKPGSRTWSIATRGCNFRCRHCQNYSLSQVQVKEGTEGHYRAPEDVVAMAQAAVCGSISYTYSEPTVFFEFMKDCARLAKEVGLDNLMVSNGYMERAACQQIAPLLDAANIDIKAFSDGFYENICGARLGPVLDTVRVLHELGVWLEITTLIIPGLNDSEDELKKLAQFLVGISPDIPWHLSAFHPAFKLTYVPTTPVETLQRSRAIGLAEGLRYVYLGNVHHLGVADTQCPVCRKTVASRSRSQINIAGIRHGKCAHCAAIIAGKWN